MTAAMHRQTGNREQGTGNRELVIGADIAERLLEFGVACLRVVGRLRRDVIGRHIAGQLARASTSGGANYEEARAAESRADFIHKVGIARKEIREAVHWLRVIRKAELVTGIDALVSEGNELVAILAVSIRTARARSSLAPAV